jgi:hypothetical protein
MTPGSEPARAGVVALVAVLSLTATGCPGRRQAPPPRPPAPATAAATRPSPGATATPTPTRPPAPPSTAPPAAVESLPAGAATELVAAARMTDAARRDLAAGETDRALELLERAVQVGPAAPFPYYYMAAVYLARGRAEEALVLAQRAATLAAGYPTGWAGHAHVLRGRALESLGRGDEAVRAYRAAIAADPNNVPAREALGR